jgi:hypothetical protein
MPAHPVDPLHADLVRYFEERDSLALDADDVLALKTTNDAVCIFWTHGIGYIRSQKNAKVAGFGTQAVERFIPVRTEFDLYGNTTKPGFCVHVQHSSNGNEARAWHTIAGGLRKGDMLTVRWMPNNTSEAMRERGETEDQCWLEVWPQGNKERRKVYLLDKWHGAAVAPHRMCRGSENV